MAVRVDPIKPTLKAPGTKALATKIRYDRLLSSAAFSFNLREEPFRDSLLGLAITANTANTARVPACLRRGRYTKAAKTW